MKMVVIFLAGLIFGSSFASAQQEPDFVYDCQKYILERYTTELDYEHVPGTFTLYVGTNSTSFLGIGFGSAWFKLTHEEAKVSMQMNIGSCQVSLDDRCTEAPKFIREGESDIEEELPNGYYNTNLAISTSLQNGEPNGTIQTGELRSDDRGVEYYLRTEFRCSLRN